MSRDGEAGRDPVKYRVHLEGGRMYLLSTDEPRKVIDFLVAVKAGVHPDYPPDSDLWVKRRKPGGSWQWLTPNSRDKLSRAVSDRLGPDYDARDAARRWHQLRAAKRAPAKRADSHQPHATPQSRDDFAQAVVEALREHTRKPTTLFAQPVSELEQATTEAAASESSAKTLRFGKGSPDMPEPPPKPSAWSTVEEPARQFTLELGHLVWGGTVAIGINALVWAFTYPSRECPGETRAPGELAVNECNVFLERPPFPKSTAELICWGLVALTLLVGAAVWAMAKSTSTR